MLLRVALARCTCDLSKYLSLAVTRRNSSMSSPPKHFKKTVKIGVHSGSFHCDEALACYFLRQLPEYKHATIVRTRDAKTLEDCDVVCDVGGVYNPATNRFDHHQREFKESMNSLNPALKWTTKLSSAGLVYYHFGHRVLEELLSESKDSKIVKLLFDRVYENFVEEVDAIDNGIDPYQGTPRYAITTNLSARVSYLNPHWNEPPEKHTDENRDINFLKAVQLVGTEFADKVNYYYKVWWPARSLVEKAYQKRFELDESGEIVGFASGGVPWKEHLLDLEKELGSKPLVKYALYQDTNSSWRVQCVPAERNSFENRRSLPEKWRGLRDDELSQVTGIPDCVFVHTTGFIGGNRTFEGVLSMARHALK